MDMGFFDSHAHYNDERFLGCRDELVLRLFESGVCGIVCAGYSFRVFC